jgi:hypothetical protein
LQRDFFSIDVAMVVITINPVPIVLELMEQSVPARFTAWHRELRASLRAVRTAADPASCAHHQ